MKFKELYESVVNEAKGADWTKSWTLAIIDIDKSEFKDNLQTVIDQIKGELSPGYELEEISLPNAHQLRMKIKDEKEAKSLVKKYHPKYMDGIIFSELIRRWYITKFEMYTGQKGWKTALKSIEAICKKENLPYFYDVNKKNENESLNVKFDNEETAGQFADRFKDADVDFVDVDGKAWY